VIIIVDSRSSEKYKNTLEKTKMGLVWFGLWYLMPHSLINNISVISWWSVLLLEVTGVHGENHRPAASH
jgi:hypothetical protein